MAMRRCRARLSVPLVFAGLLAVACGGYGATGAGQSARPSGAAAPGRAVAGWPVIRGAKVTSLIVISSADDETFAPPPAWARPRLDGVQAWDRSFLGRRNGEKPRPIPADLSYRLGLLTVPPSVTDVLAWGFSGPPGPCLRLGRGLPAGRGPRPRSVRRASPQRCIEWTFINAANASNPDGTWQPLSPRQRPPAPPPGTAALRSGGFLDASPERVSPQRLVVQGPLSTIRWTFDTTTCSIALYWFSPPQSQRQPAPTTCPRRHAFSAWAAWDATSRGHVFSVIAGYLDGPNRLVRAVLADGQAQVYDPRATNGAWLFAVQRCGNYPGTALRAIQEITPDNAIVATLTVPATTSPATPSGCRH
jgi:hypothetical protein